jgi:hypothetical protein
MPKSGKKGKNKGKKKGSKNNSTTTTQSNISDEEFLKLCVSSVSLSESLQNTSLDTSSTDTTTPAPGPAPGPAPESDSDVKQSSSQCGDSEQQLRDTLRTIVKQHREIGHALQAQGLRANCNNASTLLHPNISIDHNDIKVGFMHHASVCAITSTTLKRLGKLDQIQKCEYFLLDLASDFPGATEAYIELEVFGVPTRLYMVNHAPQLCNVILNRPWMNANAKAMPKPSRFIAMATGMISHDTNTNTN